MKNMGSQTMGETDEYIKQLQHSVRKGMDKAVESIEEKDLTSSLLGGDREGFLEILLRYNLKSKS